MTVKDILDYELSIRNIPNHYIRYILNSKVSNSTYNLYHYPTGETEIVASVGGIFYHVILNCLH